jgi:hypothetical protein
MLQLVCCCSYDVDCFILASRCGKCKFRKVLISGHLFRIICSTASTIVLLYLVKLSCSVANLNVIWHSLTFVRL